MTLHVLGLFCEDIREEKSGQVSLVGILPDTMNLPAPPSDVTPEEYEKLAAVVPKLGLYIRVRLAQDDPDSEMPISLTTPDGATIELGKIDAALIAKAKKEARDSQLPLVGLIFHAVLQGFQIAKPGVISAIVRYEGQPYVCAMLNVKPHIFS